MSGMTGRSSRNGGPARTPLFGAIKRMLGQAQLANQWGQARAEDWICANRDRRITRRTLMKASATAAFALGTSDLSRRAACAAGARERATSPRIAIVGAGITGLCAAYDFQKADVAATVYEAGTRIGGRIFTVRDVLAPGLVSELGGEFIDSDHDVLLHLVRELGFELIDLGRPFSNAGLRDTYYFQGRHYSEQDIIEAFRPWSRRMRKDREEIDDLIDYQHEGGAGRFDRMSITEYLDSIEATGWLRSLLEVAYVDEFGLDCSRLSALNLLTLISTEIGSNHFAIYGDSDERYKIKGGNKKVLDALAACLPRPIQFQHSLVSLRTHGDGYRLIFAVPGQRSKEIDADFVIVTLPFSVLKYVDLRVDLPAVQKKAIAELGYGTNTKLLAGVRRPVWREQGFTGSVFSDQPFQSAWENSRFQTSDNGDVGLTLFLGGKAGLEAGEGTAEAQVTRLLPGLERAFPGVSKLLNGRTERCHWASNRYARGSYACYLPGQWTTIAGCEGRPAGNLFFAGEHCSFGSSGYMNSGAASGRSSARKVLARCRDV